MPSMQNYKSPLSPPQARSSSGADALSDSPTSKSDEAASRLKRTACVLCRKRKLKCDASRPKCTTCHRLGHNCEYNEVRKKSGPKRGYVKALEARLASVETQLKTSTDGSSTSQSATTKNKFPPSMQDGFPSDTTPNSQSLPFNATHTANLDYSSAPPPYPGPGSFGESYPCDVIPLGLEEPMPNPDVMNELYELYFKKIHPTCPMVHRGRFLNALNFGQAGRPPVALRYAMWTLAAAMSDQYAGMAEHFYRRARKYAQLDEMRGFGEGMISLHYCQTWILLAIFEFKNMHFPRAWLSTGRAVRLAQMMGLHRVDGQGLEVKQCLLTPVDWTEKEERRRTFWMAFWEDRCASIGTGWPMTIDERDIMTNLPSSDEAFSVGTVETTPSLLDVINGKSTEFSNFGGAIVLTGLFGRNLHHLHRPGPDDREEDLNGAFWERHRMLDAVLLNLSMTLPDKQRIPLGLPDPNVIFMNMCIQTSVICLHQAAIFKIDKNNLPASLGQESKVRCVTAAAEIATIMRSVSHCELAIMNPFTAFCLYVASRVFVQYLKSRRNDQHVMSSLNFLLSAMHAMKRKNPLNESFLAQLEVDLEAASITTNHQSATESLMKKGIYPHYAKNNNNIKKDNRCPVAIANPSADLGVPEPSTTIPTNMQANIGSSNTSEMTLPMCQNGPSPPHHTDGPVNTFHMPDSSIGLLNESRTNAIAVEEMDLSPANSGNESTPSIYTHRSGSTGATAYSPPETSANDATMQGQQNGNANKFQEQDVFFWNASGDDMGRTNSDNIQVQNTNFYPFSLDDGPAMTVGGNGNSISMPSPMNQQELENLIKQSFALTPGTEHNGWLGSSGMTPTANGGAEDWNQIMLESLTGWENDTPRAGQAWSLGRGV